MLLDLVIRKIGETYGPPALRSILLSTARELSVTLGAVSDDLPYRERLRKVTDALDGLGFAAKLEEEDGKTSIVSKHCILFRTAEANHDLLGHKFHSEWSYMNAWVMGGPFCRHPVIKSDRDD